MAFASYFGLRLRQVERTTATLTPPTTWTPELRELWAPLLSQDRPLVVVLATQQSGNLTGVSTANGAFLLGQFLADRKQNVYVTSSEELSMPDIIMGNLVFLGPPSGNRQLAGAAVERGTGAGAGGNPESSSRERGAGISWQSSAAVGEEHGG